VLKFTPRELTVPDSLAAVLEALVDDLLKILIY